MRPKLTDRDVLAAMDRVAAGTILAEGYPAQAELEISRVIVEWAKDAQHLEAAAEHLVNTSRWRPVAAEWREALELTAPKEGTADFVSRGCSACDWTGFRWMERAGFSGVDRCECLRAGKAQPRPEEPVSAEVLRANLREKARLEGQLAGKVVG